MIRDTRTLLNEMLPQSQSNSNPSSRRSSADSDSSFLSNYYNRCEEVLDEVDAYLNLQWIPEENINVFQWWMQRRTMFQNLSKVAFKMHSIPASSLQSERTFSKGGLTVNDRRSNLDPNTVEDLILLNKNYVFEVWYLSNFSLLFYINIICLFSCLFEFCILQELKEKIEDTTQTA